jgi:hypothetical protein
VTNATADTDQFPLEEAAATLRELNPDVLLLQQVRDWRMCEQLAQALEPANYKVLICSSFGDVGAATSRRQQVAILSKAKAYFAWWDAWRKGGEAVLPGGLAFAAVQFGEQRVGLFSVQAGSASAIAGDGGQSAARLKAQAASVSQLLEQVSSVGKWVTNQVQVFVVSGTFDAGREDRLVAQETPLGLLEESGFGNAFLPALAGERMAQPRVADNIFTQPAGCATNIRITSTPDFAYQPITCDVELDPSKVAAAKAARVEASLESEPLPSSQTDGVKAEPKPNPSAPTPPPVQPGPPASAAVSQPSTLNPQPLWLAAAALGGIFAVAALAWRLAKRRHTFPPATPALITGWADAGRDFPSSYTVVLGTRSATQLAPADSGASSAPHPLIHIETPGATQTQAEVLRQRALAAEQRADRATAVIRSGLVPLLSYWLKQKLLHKLVTDRSRMLETQHTATLKVAAVEERLTRIEQQIQRQNSTYQERIEALTRELAAAREENRALIRARIAEVKAESEAARARLLAQSEADGDGGL